jgi:hypothetical protein
MGSRIWRPDRRTVAGKSRVERRMKVVVALVDAFRTQDGGR